MERANRHAHVAHKIVEFKKQGLKYQIKKAVPNESKVTYDLLSSRVIKELQNDVKSRGDMKILMTETRGWKHRLPDKPMSQSAQKREKQILTSRSMNDYRFSVEKTEIDMSTDHPASETARDGKSFGRDTPSRLTRIDRASRAISRKLKMLKTLNTVFPKDIKIATAHTSPTTRVGSFLPNSSCSRERTPLPFSNRSLLADQTRFLQTEKWLPKTKLT